MEDKKLIEIAELWLGEPLNITGLWKEKEDYDIIDVWKNDDGGYHIEISYFEKGKYYSGGLLMPTQFVNAILREEALNKLLP
jgi:hypothetical protein